MCGNQAVFAFVVGFFVGGYCFLYAYISRR
jgi:hypothetical protein